MAMQPCQPDNRSFFEKLQNADGLDLRDKRGQRHDLAVVLTGLVLALLSNRDGSLSSLHRHLVNHYGQLVAVLGVEKKKPVSRSQLPLILGAVAVCVLERLLWEHYGLKLKATEKKWFALDGKELRGSIAKGATRGTAIVQAVSHEGRRVVAQDYYAGEKESEVPVVRKLLQEGGLGAQKVSLDALHCKPATLALVTRQGGKYLVGVKDNQKELKKQISLVVAGQSCLLEMTTTEKGHGRIETRNYQFYDVMEMPADERWEACHLKTAVQVTRLREALKGGHKSVKESYYVSNEVGCYEELAGAIRGHWQVETNNHVRDVTLREDRLRSCNRKLQQTMGSLRTVTVALLGKTRCGNKKAQVEEFGDNFAHLMVTLKSFNFL